MDAPEKEKLVLKRSVLGLGKITVRDEKRLFFTYIVLFLFCFLHLCYKDTYMGHSRACGIGAFNIS